MTAGCAVTADACTPRHRPRTGAVAHLGIRRTVRLGTSVQGRPVTAVELGVPTSSRKVLVIGCIHGDEPAGAAIVRMLADGAAPDHADLWMIPELNPDGVAAGTRGNARGVDLNRNFPHGWRPIGRAGSVYFSGAGPLSESESRLAAALIQRLRPTVAIWFHQHMAVVDTSEGPKSVARRFAQQVGLPERSLTDHPGSATGWENTIVPHSAFVVELPAGTLSPRDVQRYVAAVRAMTNP